MKRPAIFFDRDNTLIASDGYLGDPSKVELVDGAADAVAQARHLGYAVVVVSNQSGVARGMFTEDDVRAVNARLDDLLKSANADAVIDRHEYCPDHPEATVEAYRHDTDLRKPGPGMILAAADSLALDLSRSWLVGDAPRDIEAGQAAGCRTVLFRDATLPSSPAASEILTTDPDAVVASLREAMDYIASDPPARPDMHPAITHDDDDQPDEDEIPPTFAPVRSSADDPNGHSDDIDSEVEDEESKPYIGHASPDLRSVAVKLASPSGPATTPPSRIRNDPPPAPHPVPTARLESFAEQILQELRRQTELGQADFSVSKLLAGIIQVMSVAVMFLAYLNRTDGSFEPLLIFAVWLEVLTVALLLMGRQR